MIVDTREVRNVSQYARMLEFVCAVMQLCGGFEPEKLLQPQVPAASPPLALPLTRPTLHFSLPATSQWPPLSAHSFLPPHLPPFLPSRP